jgi:hypothetical protein
MSRPNAAGDDTRAALLALLGIHTEGATTSELAVYMNRNRFGIRYEMLRLESEEQVVSTPGDRNTKLWHLTPRVAEVRSLASTPASRLPPPPRPAHHPGLHLG